MNISAYNDENGSYYQGNSLPQLNKDTTVIDVQKDPLSGVKAVVLTKGPFEYQQTSLINNTLKDYRKVCTSSLTNASVPSIVQPGSKYDIRINLAGDYFFLPNSLEVVLTAKLQVKENSGTLRNIKASDCLTPVDGLCFVKNIRPQFDNLNTIPPSKELNQRLYRRVIDVITKSNDEESLKLSIENDMLYFENQSLEDNKTGKMHSHKYTQDNVAFTTSTDDNYSAQNSILSQMLTDEFVCKLNFNSIPPLDVAKVHSRPVESLLLSLEICSLSEWLILCTPDGVKPTPLPTPSAEIFNKLCLTITGVTHSYAQVVLNDALYAKYLKNTTDGRIASTSHNIIDYHFLSNPIPIGTNSWTVTLLNQTVPDKYFLIFRTSKNALEAGGNVFFFNNVGLKQITMRMPECTLNRYNQIRSSFWAQDTDVIVKSLAKYKALSLNKQKIADLASQDLILIPNALLAGDNVGDSQRKTYVCNSKSIYEGFCVYAFSTSVQTQTNNNLKSSTRKGNICFTFDFAEATEEKYYVTIFGEHNGEFYR